MKAQNVCTVPTTHRGIVSFNSKALGATTSSRRIRGDENHFIFVVGTKHHLCARNSHGTKMFTLLLQVIDLMLINLIYSLTAGSSFYSVLSLLAVCKDPSVLLTVHSALDFMRNFDFFDFHFLTKNPPLCPSDLVIECSNFQFRNPHLNSQREHLLLGIMIEAGSGSQSAIRNGFVPVYRLLSEMIGFQNFFSLHPTNSARPLTRNSTFWSHKFTYGHINSLNVNGKFLTTYSRRSRSNQNPKNCQNKKSDNVNRFRSMSARASQRATRHTSIHKANVSRWAPDSH
jgi:hypothetical protein